MSSFGVSPDDLLVPLAYLMKQTHARLAAVADHALGASGVERREFGALRALAVAGPLSQQQVGLDAAVDPATLVSIIDRLEEKKFVTRRQDPSDRRRNVVDLTPAGKKSWRAAEAAYAAAEEGFLAPLGDERARKFREDFTKLLGAHQPG